MQITSAAPASTDVMQYFLDLGLPLNEGWGMSELSCFATMNPPHDIRMGTVGRALPGVELRLLEDGELLVRAPLVLDRELLARTSGGDMPSSASLRDAVATAVKSANAGLSRVEQIKRFAILDTEWLPGGDELTLTMKLKRRPILDKYAAEVQRLYG